MEKNLRNNQGMSLIELLVSVAVLSVAMVGILALMNASAQYFSHSNKEVEVQQELQATFSLVSAMIEEANNPQRFEWNATNKEVIIRGKSHSYAIKLSGTKLYAKEFLPTDTPTTSITGSNDANLLADHVTGFSINTDKFDEGYVILAMTVKYGKREAAMTKNIFMRNSGKEKADFLGQCNASSATVNGRKVTFTIEQNTASTISSGTAGVITAKIAAGSGWSVSAADVKIKDASGASVCSVSKVSYNNISGVVTIHCTSSAAWEKGANHKITVEITITGGGTITSSNCRILGIRK